MSFQLILTSQAQEQLWEISQWYAKTSPIEAASYGH